MSDLTAFRDHCRKMAAADHKPECPSLKKPGWVVPEPGQAGEWMGLVRYFPPGCDGCNPAVDRDLFERLAGEVDEYLGRPVDVDLFGELSEMPTSVEESAL